MKVKLLIGLAIILAVVLIVLVKNDQKKNERAAFERARNKTNSKYVAPKIPELPEVSKTTNIDSQIAGIFTDTESEMSLVSDDDNDIMLINDGMSLLNAEGVYDANQY